MRRKSDYFNPVMEAYMSITPPGPYDAANIEQRFRGWGPPNAFCIECSSQCAHWSDTYCQTCARRIIAESRTVSTGRDEKNSVFRTGREGR